MREAFSEGVAQNNTGKIFNTIPDFVFWDIKKPLVGENHHITNPYNPGRAHHNTDFFDMRSQEQWATDRSAMRNIHCGISTRQKY